MKMVDKIFHLISKKFINPNTLQKNCGGQLYLNLMCKRNIKELTRQANRTKIERSNR